MIDTVKFKIGCTEEEKNDIKRNSFQIEKKNNLTGVVDYKVYTTTLNLGSYDRDVKLYIGTADDVSIELSVPKYVYGHNIYLLYWNEYINAIKQLHSDLKEKIKTLPDLNRWQYQRIDVCYAWKLKDESTAQLYLDTFRKFLLNPKNRIDHASSYMDKGKTLSTKFYMKHPEYKVHDYRYFLKYSRKHPESQIFEEAEQLLEKSKGILRFETTIRKNALMYHFGNKIYFSTITKKDIIYLLTFYLEKAIKFRNTQFMTTNNVLEQLKKTYKKRLARQLYLFYNSYFSENPEQRKILLREYSQQGMSKNLLLIKKASVGLPAVTDIPASDFMYPSKYAVNSDPDPAQAGAG